MLRIEYNSESLQLPSPTNISTYLKNSGWTKVDFPKQESALFKKYLNGEEVAEAFFPLNDKYNDFDTSLERALRSIAKAEGLNLYELVDKIETGATDSTETHGLEVTNLSNEYEAKRQEEIERKLYEYEAKRREEIEKKLHE